jgi:hypothetical protein
MPANSELLDQLDRYGGSPAAAPSSCRVAFGAVHDRLAVRYVDVRPRPSTHLDCLDAVRCRFVGVLRSSGTPELL